MEILESEKRRARNQIWTAAEEYGFEPDFKTYDARGRADLYWNTVVGCVRRNWNGGPLAELLRSFEGSVDCQLYEQLAWLGLESAAFHRERDRRPALPALRRAYAARALAELAARPSDRPVHLLTAGRCRAILGRELELGERDRAVLAALDLSGELDEAALAEAIRAALARYFGYVPAPAVPGEAGEPPPAGKRRLFGSQRGNRIPLPAVRGFGYGFGEHGRSLPGGGEAPPRRRLGDMSLTRSTEALRVYIASYFGAPLYPGEKVKALERALCTGDHRGCRLYYARGGDDLDRSARGYAGAQRRAALKQMEKNRAAYDADLTRNRACVARLTARIQNALLAHLQPVTARTAAGRLDAARAWRAAALDDGKVFSRVLRGDPGDLCVDILLDASTSQTQRQETVAAQGYMIAESLTRCAIPVRVTAFCSLSGYTVLTRFRDYGETDRNENIFHYFTTGCNRDGLAVRALGRALGRALEDAPCDHRLVILLSDAKPNDVIKVARDGAYLDYADQTGVQDTAREVRAVGRGGASVICVFTGEDEDLPAARVIYGRSFTRIRRLDQFADTVGSLIQNQIRNM